LIAGGGASITLRSSWCVFLWPNSRPPGARGRAQFRDQRDHHGADAGHQPVGFLALVAARQQSARSAGQIGHVRAPLIDDQVEAGAQPVPALLERRDARVAAADFERDRGGGKWAQESARRVWEG
jgi:hypothetical protein